MTDNETYLAIAAILGWYFAVLFWVKARVMTSMYDDTTRLLGWRPDA